MLDVKMTALFSLRIWRRRPEQENLKFLSQFPVSTRLALWGSHPCQSARSGGIWWYLLIFSSFQLLATLKRTFVGVKIEATKDWNNHCSTRLLPTLRCRSRAARCVIFSVGYWLTHIPLHRDYRPHKTKGGVFFFCIFFLSWLLVASVSSAASVASMASMAPGSYGSSIIYLSVKRVHQVHVVH